jgi:hypothetical protein
VIAPDLPDDYELPGALIEQQVWLVPLHPAARANEPCPEPMGSEIVVGALRGKTTRPATASARRCRSAEGDGGAETQDDRAARPARMSLFSRIIRTKWPDWLLGDQPS